MPQVRLLNEESTARESVVTVGVPFEKGVLTASDTLEVVGATSRIEKVQWYPQGARYSDNSVKYARCTFPVELTANQNKICEVRVGSNFQTSPFSISSDIVQSIYDTQIRLTLSPSLPVKVTGTVSRIDTVPVPGDSSQNFIITFNQNILEGHVQYAVNTSNNTLEWASGQGYRIRLEGLNEPFSILNGVILEGKMLAENVFNKLKFSGSRFTSSIIWQPSYAPSGHVAYFQDWTFTPLSSVNLDLNFDDITSPIEGNGSVESTDHYFRTRYFKRFEDHPSGRPLKPMWMEVVVDTFSNKPYQRFWVRIGNSYFEHLKGRNGGLYKEPGIFFSGDIKLKVRSRLRTVQTVPFVHLRDQEYQTYSSFRNTTETSYTILTENPPWKNSNPYAQIMPNLNVFPNSSCMCYQGVIYHGAQVESRYQAEMLSDVRAIALNWENLMPPFFATPPYPGYITSEADAISRIDSWVEYFNNTRRTPQAPFIFGFVLGSAGVTSQAGNQTLSFGAFPSYYCVRAGWPSFEGPVLWWTRQEWWRPGMGYMSPTGDNIKFQDYKTTSQSLGYVISGGVLFHGSQNYGGLGINHPYSYITYPEGPLTGPIPGNSIYVKREEPIGLDQNYTRWTRVTNYASSHYACHWQSIIALVTMDYMALKWIEIQADRGIAGLWEYPYGFAEAQFGAYKPAREVARPAHYFAFFYEITGESYIREFLETRFGSATVLNRPISGGTTPTPVSFYGGSALKEILDNPSSFANPYDYVTFYGPWEGFDRRALWTDSWASVWMEGMLARGYYAIYRVLKDYYGSEGAFSTAADNIKTMAKYISSSVTRHGFIFDCRYQQGEYVWVEGVKNTSYNAFPYNGIINSSVISPDAVIFYDARPGDTVRLNNHSSNISGTVILAKKEDVMSYNKNSSGWTKKPNSDGTPQNWGIRYTILIKLDNPSNSLPATGGFNLYNDRNQRTLFCNRMYNGWMIGYSLHAGWSVKRNTSPYGAISGPDLSLTSSTPPLPSGTPLGTGHYNVEADLVHYPVETTGSLNYINENPAFAPLSSGYPRYYSLSSSLQLWTYGACAITKYFADQGDYPLAVSGEVVQKANEILSFQQSIIPIKSAASDWGGWDLDFTVHAYPVSQSFENNSDYTKIASPIFVSCRQNTPSSIIPPIGGGGSSDYSKNINTTVITVFTSPPTIVTTSSSNAFLNAPTTTVFCKVPAGTTTVINNPQGYSKTASTININARMYSPQIIVVNADPSDFEVSLSVKTTMNNLFDADLTEDTDIIIQGTNYTEQDLLDLGLQLNKDGYNGPLPGYYNGFTRYDNDNVLSSGTSGNIKEYFESAQGLTFTYEEQAPIGII